MRTVCALAALAALAVPSHARIFQGTATGTWPFVGKFSFPANKDGSAVGNMKLTWSYPGGATNAATLLEFDDDAWATVYQPQNYPGGCGAAFQAASAAAPGYQVAAMAIGGQQPATQSFTESVRPHYWFFTLAVGPDCSQGVNVQYTVELTQADGGQLGYDEIGMPSIYGAFFTLSLLLVAAHAYAHYYAQKFSPVLVRAFTVSLALTAASYFCHMIDWATVSSTGVGVPAMAVLGGLLRLAAMMALWVTCALTAVGYGVVTYSVDEKRYNWVGAGLLAGLLVSYLALAIYFAVDLDPRVVVSFGSLWPAVTLLLLTIAFAAWWAWKLRETYLAEVNTTKKALLRRLALVLAGNFFILPVAEFIGAVTPAYERTRVVTGFDLFFVLVINAALVYLLWPSHAADAFRVYDGSVAASMLGDSLGLGGGLAGAGDGSDFSSALDEAYAYTAAPGQGDAYLDYSGSL